MVRLVRITYCPVLSSAKALSGGRTLLALDLVIYKAASSRE